MSVKKYHIAKKDNEWKATVENGSRAAIVTTSLEQMQQEVKN